MRGLASGDWTAARAKMRCTDRGPGWNERQTCGDGVYVRFVRDTDGSRLGFFLAHSWRDQTLGFRQFWKKEKILHISAYTFCAYHLAFGSGRGRGSRPWWYANGVSVVGCVFENNVYFSEILVKHQISYYIFTFSLIISYLVLKRKMY